MKKILSVAIAILCMFTCFTGCVRPTPQGNNNSNQTELHVYGYNGGVGNEWLYAMESSFEQKYAETEFEPGSGKKGVDVVVSKGLDTMTTNIPQQKYAIVFTEQAYPFTLSASGDLLPITDMVQSSLADITDGKEDVSIESKLDTTVAASLKAIRGEYYTLPHYEAYSGITYDVKVFEDNALFFKNGGGWTSIESEKAVGPDGKKGTYDDGLPTSVEEFITLMDQMVAVNVTPFIWTGAYDLYIIRYLIGMEASLSGYDEYMLNYNFGNDSVVKSGTAKVITGFNGQTPIVESKAISNETGYYMMQTESKYYSQKILEKILSNAEYYSPYMDDTLTASGAQGQFIMSDLQSNTEPVAMLIEGSYWYNEAGDYFDRAENTYKVKAKDRKFAWMPLPVQIKGSVQEGEHHTQTLVSANSSYVFINGNIKDDENLVKLAKLFLKHCYTNESLVNFYLTTGLFKGVATDLTGVDISSMDYYKQSIAKVKANSKVCSIISDNPITMNAYKSVLTDYDSIIDGDPFTYPINAFEKGKTAEQYFQGMWIEEQTWRNSYKDFFN